MGALRHLSVLGKGDSLPTGGLSDCIICAKEDPRQSGPNIFHVMEALSFHPNEQTVKMYINVISNHEGDTPVRYRVIHRCKTTAYLRKFTFDDPDDPRPAILSELYADRFKNNPDDPQTAIFHRRVNCFGIDPNGVIVSLAGPGRCFEEIGDEVPLDSEIEDLREDVPFTSYLIPPLEAPEIKPGETAICTLKLEIARETYKKLVGVGSDISVDSYARLMRDIETYDLPGSGNKKFEELYRTNIKAKGAIIKPLEYDIVIFQEIGQSIKLKSGSISTTPVRLSDESLSEKVLSFYGEGSEFCLRFAYPAEVITEQKRILREMALGQAKT